MADQETQLLKPDSNDAPPLCCSKRLSLAIVMFFGSMNLYALRINLSVGIVCMINQTALQSHILTPDGSDVMYTEDLALASYASDTNSNCAKKYNVNSTSHIEGEFDWDKKMQGIILGSFFWGYLITQIPGGLLAEHYGGKRVYGYFMLMTAVATLLTPGASYISPYFLVALRIVCGLGEGVSFPATHAMWSKWAPPLERSKLVSASMAGAQIGNVITLTVSGLLCYNIGWSSIFFLFGSLGIVWFLAWMLIAMESPDQDPYISQVEKDYINSSIGRTGDTQQKIKELGTPWKAIMTSYPVWAIVIAHACCNWGTYTLLTNIPTYMYEVLKFDIRTNGVLSAIPYIAFWIGITLSGILADKMRTKGWKTATVRKIFTSIGTLIPALFLIATGYITCEQAYVAVILLTLAVGIFGMHYAGPIVNHLDIAPPFAGLLFGISNAVATIPGILAPYIIGIVTSHQTQAEWQTVFYISAGVYVLGWAAFTVMADGEIQDWAKPYMFQ